MRRFVDNYLLPKDDFGEALYAILAVLTLGTYVARYLLSLTGNYGPLGLIGLLCLPLICLPILGIAVYLCASGIYFWKSKNPVPLIALFPLVALATYFLPLGPMPPTREERHFKNHRADYEHIVDLARQGELSPIDAQWEAEVIKQNPLVMTFSPTRDDRVIAYADEERNLRNTSPCDKGGSIYKQLDNHWWLCYREWN